MRIKIAVIVITLVAVYWPGLSSTFMLDDYATLMPLAQWVEINTFDKLWLFVTSGYAGPMGRPIPLLTFALNGTTWPADPKPFIATNIAIHAINTLLVFALIRELLKASNTSENSHTFWLPWLAAALWGLHPYLASSVLYVVQRMTLLAAGFSFLCLFLYLRARFLLIKGSFIWGAVLLILAALSSLAALYSKENAVLIPLQLALVELYLRWVNAERPRDGVYAILVGVIGLVSAIVLYKLGDYAYPHIKAMVLEGRSLSSRREFTFFERQLTEARVVGEYIISIIVPRPQTSGVFQDGYVLSRSLTYPPSTWVWMVIHTTLLALAWLVRRKTPLLAFGILWFYVGHIVESSVVMLEIKFEHRNYLPSLGILLPIAAGLCSLKLAPRLRVALAGVILVVFAGTLYARTSLWGNPEQAAMVWVEENPNSARALENAALVLSKQPDRYSLVANLLKRAAEMSPNDPMLAIKYRNYICRQLSSDSTGWTDIAEQFEGAEVNWQLYHVLEESLEAVASGRCSHINLEEFNTIASAVLQNKRYRRTGTPKLVRELQARAALIFGDHQLAVELYQKEAARNPPLSMVMRYALWLASYDQQSAAAEILSGALERGEKGDPYLYEQAQDMQRKIEADITPQKKSTDI